MHFELAYKITILNNNNLITIININRNVDIHLTIFMKYYSINLN
jgi:hypothetical protein